MGNDMNVITMPHQQCKNGTIYFSGYRQYMRKAYSRYQSSKMEYSHRFRRLFDIESMCRSTYLFLFRQPEINLQNYFSNQLLGLIIFQIFLQLLGFQHRWCWALSYYDYHRGNCGSRLAIGMDFDAFSVESFLS